MTILPVVQAQPPPLGGVRLELQGVPAAQAVHVVIRGSRREQGEEKPTPHLAEMRVSGRAPRIGLGDLTNGPIEGDGLIAFTAGRCPVHELVNWDNAPATLIAKAAKSRLIHLAPVILNGDPRDQWRRALQGMLMARALFHQQNMGIDVRWRAPTFHVDAQGVDRHGVFRGRTAARLIKRFPPRDSKAGLRVYFTDAVASAKHGTGSRVGVWHEYTSTIGMGSRASPHLLAHELGHAFDLPHRDQAMLAVMHSSSRQRAVFTPGEVCRAHTAPKSEALKRAETSASAVVHHPVFDSLGLNKPHWDPDRELVVEAAAEEDQFLLAVHRHVEKECFVREPGAPRTLLELSWDELWNHRYAIRRWVLPGRWRTQAKATGEAAYDAIRDAMDAAPAGLLGTADRELLLGESQEEFVARHLDDLEAGYQERVQGTAVKLIRSGFRQLSSLPSLQRVLQVSEWLLRNVDDQAPWFLDTIRPKLQYYARRLPGPAAGLAERLLDL